MEKPQVRVRDRISGLPDEILCHILSFIPTLWVVRTSVLSTRWKNLWTFVRNLDFADDHTFWHYGEGLYGSSRFMTFVDRVLLFRVPSDIGKFKLFCSYPVDLSRVDGWICYAIRHNVVEFDFHCYDNRGMTFELPQSIFMCKSLVALALSSDCTTYAPPRSSCFPSLKSLSLFLASPDDYSSIEKLVSCCSQFPVLESLKIYGFHGIFAHLKLIISSPTLKTLTISLFSRCNSYPYNVFINAPKLEILHLNQDTFAHYHLEDTKSVVKANIVLEICHVIDKTTFTNRVTELLMGFSNVKSLSLSTHCSDGCRYEGADSWRGVDNHYHFFWQLLPGLLIISRNLEHLVLENRIESGHHLKHKYWKRPLSLRSCLLHLKTISIRKFKGRQVEREVAKYLLKYCKALNKMMIYTCSLDVVENELYREFSTFKKGSKACQVEFTKM